MTDFDHTVAAESLAANEFEITRLRADLARAEQLLAERGVLFTRSPNLAMPWVKAQDNSAAIAKAARAAADLAEMINQMCGPAAYHRINGRPATIDEETRDLGDAGC